MNIRWLWLDHFPPGLDIAPEQRKLIIQSAKRDRKTSKDPRVRRESLAYFLLTMIPLSIGFTLWVVYPPKWPTFGMKLAVLIAQPLVFNALVWVVITYGMYRVSARFVRRALCEHGIPVCMECGYILRGLRGDDIQCPECGAPCGPLVANDGKDGNDRRN